MSFSPLRLILAVSVMLGGIRLGATTTVLPELTNAWEQVSLHIVDKDLEGRFINANELFLATLRAGFPEIQTVQDLAGKTDFDFYPEELANAYRAADQEVLASGMPWEAVERNEPVGGPATFVFVNKTPLRDEANQIVALRITFYAIPEPGQTTLPEFPSLWMQANAWIIDKDTNSVFINANELFVSYLRASFPHILTVTNLIGRDDRYFYPVEQYEKFRADDHRVMTQNVAFENIEVNQPEGGARIYLQVRKFPLRDAEGNVFGIRIFAWEVPQIFIRRIEQSVEISWPGSAADFQLQQGTQVPGTAWEAVDTIPNVSADPITVTLPVNGTQAMFRLGLIEERPPEWTPEGPVTLVVPWAPNGSTDQMARRVAALLEPELGQKIFVVNLPGNSGAHGTEAVLQSPRDGLTWLAGAAADLSLYKILGLLDTAVTDWTLYLPVSHAQVYAVGPSTSFTNFAQLLEGFQNQPGVLRVGTAGSASAGAVAMHLLQQHVGIEFTTVSYNGGSEVAAALAAGEVDVMAQLAADGADLMRAGLVRPLAVLGTEALIIEGVEHPIPPVNQWIPGLQVSANYFGIFLPKGTPANVRTTLEQIWNETIPGAPELQAYANQYGARFNPFTGSNAQDEVFKYLQPVAWSLFDAGIASVSPESLGIPKP